MSDLTDGYMDGLKDDRIELPASFANRSDEYCHAWLNGRDDRRGKPRASAAELREAIAAIKANENSMKGADE